MHKPLDQVHPGCLRESGCCVAHHAAVLTGVVRHFFLCFSEDLVILVEGEGEKSSKYLKILFVEGCPLGKGKITWLIPLKNEVQHMFSVVKTPSCFAMK